MMNGVHHQAGGLPNLTWREMFEEYKEFLLVSLHFVFQGRLDSEGHLGFPAHAAVAGICGWLSKLWSLFGYPKY